MSSVISSNSKRPKKVTISYPYIQFALNGTQADSLRASWIAGWAMPLAAEEKSQKKKGGSHIGKYLATSSRKGLASGGSP